MNIDREIFNKIHEEHKVIGQKWSAEQYYDQFDKVKYRIYHSDGYCVNVEAEYEPDSNQFEYTVMNYPQDEFKKATKQQVLDWVNE